MVPAGSLSSPPPGLLGMLDEDEDEDDAKGEAAEAAPVLPPKGSPQTPLAPHPQNYHRLPINQDLSIPLWSQHREGDVSVHTGFCTTHNTGGMGLFCKARFQTKEITSNKHTKMHLW